MMMSRTAMLGDLRFWLSNATWHNGVCSCDVTNAATIGMSFGTSSQIKIVSGVISRVASTSLPLIHNRVCVSVRESR